MSETALEKRRLGLSEVSKIYESFDELVEEAVTQIKKVDNTVLRLNWWIGLQSWIIQETKTYGQANVEQFAGAIGMSPSSVYSAKKFYEAFSREELEDRLLKNNLAYRNALALAGCSDTSQRNVIEQATYDLALSTEEITALVKEANAGVSIPEDAEGLEQLLYDITNPNRTMPVLLEEADEPSDEEVENALADPNDEKFYLKTIRSAASGLTKGINDMQEKASELSEAVMGLDFLTKENYVKAEKRLMDSLIEIRNGMGALYMIQKELTDRNISNRSAYSAEVEDEEEED